MMDVLNVLKGVDMTKALLQAVPVGKHVNAVRKAACDDGVKSLAKKLVKKWVSVAEKGGKVADKPPQADCPPGTPVGAPLTIAVPTESGGGGGGSGSGAGAASGVAASPRVPTSPTDG
jgi:hypothetical protein